MIDPKVPTELLKTIRQLQIQADQYLETIPRDIQPIIVDNKYVNNYGLIIEQLIPQAFGQYTEDVLWFLYEFKPGRSPGPHIITPDGKEWVFRTDDDFYSYLIDL